MGKGYRGGINYELGINIYILVYRKQINKEDFNYGKDYRY